MKRKNQTPTPTLLSIAAGLGLCGLLLLLGSCGGPQGLAETRAERAAQATSDVLVGAAWPWEKRSEGMYWKGMELALNEVNDDGGVLGRPLRIVKADDRESVNDGRLVAQRFSNDVDMVAVIGHLNSHVSIPAASIYEEAGLLMITPGSTSPALTDQGYHYVFRSINSDREVGRQMARFARAKGYRRIIIAYVGNEYGHGLANAFEQEASRVDVETVDRQAYDPAVSASPKSFERRMSAWKDLDFDAIFLAGMPPQAGYFIRQARAMGITAPVFGGDALDTVSLIEAAGADAEGVVAASVFHPDNPRPEVQRFKSTFENAYGDAPDSWAARGYEVTKLLARAMQKAGSTVPAEVAAALRSEEGWKSITGTFSFGEDGSAVGKPLITSMVRSGRFAFLEESASSEASAAADAPSARPVALGP